MSNWPLAKTSKKQKERKERERQARRQAKLALRRRIRTAG